MKIFLSILIIIFSTAAISSCYYDKGELLYGGANNESCADTAGAATYVQKVVPILQKYCYSCHTGSFPSGNQLMGTYAADKAMGQNGKLYGSINHSAGISAMPKGMAKLSNCQIAIIKKWIDTGMLNN
jgi:mono/diheme cytochrome c family protein